MADGLASLEKNSQLEKETSFSSSGKKDKSIVSNAADFAGDVWDSMSLLDRAALLSSPVPVVGDVIGGIADLSALIKDPSLINAGILAAGLVPFVPSGSVTRTAQKTFTNLRNDVPGGRVTSKVATRWFRGSNNPKELEGSFTKEKEGVLGGGGVYITPNKEYAERYAKEDIFGAPKEGGFVNELEVGFKNPLVVDITSDRPYPELELFKKLGYKEDKAMDIVEKAMEEKGGLTNEVKNKVIKQGYDGIILRKDGEIQEALIYDTNNIKAIAGEVPLKKGGSVVERNPYNYTAKAI